MGRSLLSKVWDLHAVRKLPTGQTQLFVGLHLVHEVTSPQAFAMLNENGWKVAFPSRTVATVRDGNATFQPFSFSIAKACGLVTSWTRCRPTKSCVCPVGSFRTAWRSQTFERSERPIPAA